MKKNRIFTFIIISYSFLYAGEIKQTVTLGMKQFELSFAEDFNNEELKRFIAKDIESSAKFVKQVKLEKDDVNNAKSNDMNKYYKMQIIELDEVESPGLIPIEITKNLNRVSKTDKGNLKLAIPIDLLDKYDDKYTVLVDNKNLLETLEEFTKDLSKKEIVKDILDNEKVFRENVYYTKSMDSTYSFVRSWLVATEKIDVISVLHIQKSNKKEKHDYLANLAMTWNDSGKTKITGFVCVYLDDRWKIYAP